MKIFSLNEDPFLDRSTSANRPYPKGARFFEHHMNSFNLSVGKPLLRPDYSREISLAFPFTAVTIAARQNLKIFDSTKSSVTFRCSGKHTTHTGYDKQYNNDSENKFHVS